MAETPIHRAVVVLVPYHEVDLLIAESLEEIKELTSPERPEDSMETLGLEPRG